MGQSQKKTNRRLQLDAKLRDFLGLKKNDPDHLYFQPPESVKLKFDAIIYKKLGLDLRRADDGIYSLQDTYHLVIVTRDPDSPLPHDFQTRFPKASPGKVYVSENLYHHPFTLTY